MKTYTCHQALTLLSLFEKNPEKALSEVIRYRLYYPSRESTCFWNNYRLILPSLLKVHSPQQDIFLCMSRLYHFHSSIKMYQEAFLKKKQELIQTGLDRELFLKLLFFCPELWEEHAVMDGLVYHEDLLSAIKLLVKSVGMALPEAEGSSYKPEFYDLVATLLLYQLDLLLLDEALDLYLSGTLEWQYREDEPGFNLVLSPDNRKDNNLYILEKLKKQVRTQFRKKQSQVKVSGMEHFQKHDLQWKTDEGFAAFYISGGELIGIEGEGITSLPMPEGVEPLLRSQNQEEREAGSLRMLLTMLEQNYHHKLRHALANTFEPNEQVNILHMYIQTKEGVKFFLYEVFYAACCLTAMADRFRYMNEWPYSNTIHHVWKKAQEAIRANMPARSDKEIRDTTSRYLIDNFNELIKEKEVNFFVTPDETCLIGWLRQVEELKGKTEDELKELLRLLSDIDSPLPYLPLYGCGKGYLFSYISCNRFDIGRMVYDYYLSKSLFDDKEATGKEARKQVGKNHNERADSFSEQIAALFRQPGIKAKGNNKYGAGKGDLDVLVYFEQESLLLAIQVKLSNTFCDTEEKKERWLRMHIPKAAKQIKQDMERLVNPDWWPWICKELELGDAPRPAELEVYPLIVTDNFYADHALIPYTDTEEVLVVSYFELENLILGEKVHSAQVDLPGLKGWKQPGIHLIEALELNTFWDFLKHQAADFQYRKELKMAEAAKTIRVVI